MSPNKENKQQNEPNEKQSKADRANLLTQKGNRKTERKSNLQTGRQRDPEKMKAIHENLHVNSPSHEDEVKENSYPHEGEVKENSHRSEHEVNVNSPSHEDEVKENSHPHEDEVKENSHIAITELRHQQMINAPLHERVKILGKDDKKRCTVIISESTNKRFDEFVAHQRFYKQDLIELALIDLMEKYK